MKAEVRDPYTQEVVEAEPVQLPGPAADDGYSATKVGYNGAGKTALLIRVTPTGLALSVVGKDGTDDVQRASLKRLYGKRAKQMRETRALPGISTNDLTENPTE